MADEEEYDPFAEEDDDEKKKVSMTLGAGKKTKKAIAAVFDVWHCKSISLSPLAPRRPA
jgi:hypothetical protein